MVLLLTFTGADPIDHVRTQLPSAATVMSLVVICYLLNGYLGLSPLFFLPLGVVLLVVLVRGLSELDARRKGVRPIAAESAESPEVCADGERGPE